jgi:hypothetical protein
VSFQPHERRAWTLLPPFAPSRRTEPLLVCPDLVYDDLAADISVTPAGTLDGIAGFEQMEGNVVRLCNGAVVNSIDESPLPKEIVFTTR